MPMKRIFVLVSMSALLLLGTMSPSLAVTPDREHLPLNDDLVIDGVCGFPVLLHEVRSNITVTTFFDQEGNVTKQIGAGSLVVQLTNLDTDEAIVVNISGPGVFTFEGDVLTLTAEGNWLFYFFPGELGPGDPGLIWLTTGLWVWEIRPDGGSLVTHRGPSRDVCEILA